MNWRDLVNWGGLAIMFLGAVASIFVMLKMARVVNSQRAGIGKVHWEPHNAKATKKVIRLYKIQHPNGTLYREFWLYICLSGLGAAIRFLVLLP